MLDPAAKRIVESLRAVLPPVFLECRATALSGGVLQSGTMANERSRREVAKEAFAYDPSGKVIIFRDTYLDRHYSQKLAKRRVGRDIADRLRSNSRALKEEKPPAGQAGETDQGIKAPTELDDALRF